jgi:hypothetical protein
MAHGSGWGASDGGCHPPPPPSPHSPTCTLYAPHKQLLTVMVLGAGHWCSWASSSVISLVVVVVVSWPLSSSYGPGASASAFHLTSSGLSAWGSFIVIDSLPSPLFPLQCCCSTHYLPHKQWLIRLEVGGALCHHPHLVSPLPSLSSSRSPPCCHHLILPLIVVISFSLSLL